MKAVVFDVDGVLVDSRDANVALIQKLMTESGYTKPSRAAIIACYHLPLWQTLEKLTGSKDQKEIKRIWAMAHDPSLHDIHLFKFPGRLKQNLKSLHDEYKLAVVTGRIKLGLEQIFAATDIGSLFDAVVTFEDYKNPKPHPEPLLIAARLLGIKPSEAIYVGDSPGDVTSARAAGMKSIRLCRENDTSADICIINIEGLVGAVKNLA